METLSSSVFAEDGFPGVPLEKMTLARRSRNDAFLVTVELRCGSILPGQTGVSRTRAALLSETRAIEAISVFAECAAVARVYFGSFSPRAQKEKYPRYEAHLKSTIGYRGVAVKTTGLIVVTIHLFWRTGAQVGFVPLVSRVLEVHGGSARCYRSAEKDP